MVRERIGARITYLVLLVFEFHVKLLSLLTLSMRPLSLINILYYNIFISIKGRD
jgi:NADH:ubiquinone oxidoreductase subunit 3 (subunit A)